MQRIRAALVALVATLVLAAPAAADEAATGIERTIRNQIEAFRADDFATAFSFASPAIRGIFGTAENFGAMVQRGYPMVYRPADLRLLERRQVNGTAVQRVMVTDETGRTHLLDYQMIETPEGWQINGVQLLPSIGVGA
jgi:hypothetical protein